MLSCIVLLGSFKRQLRMEETFQVVGNQLIYLKMGLP